MSRKDALRARIDALGASGAVTGYYVQGGMPGLRWTLWGPGWERSRGTRETETLVSQLESAHPLNPPRAS